MSLKVCNSLHQFNQFFEVHPPEVKIGPVGGRHYYIAGEKHSLNSIIAKFKSLSPKGLSKESYDELTEGYQLLLSLHKKGNRCLAQANLFQRILTPPRQFFGRLACKGHYKALKLNKYECALQTKELNGLKTQKMFQYETFENPFNLLLGADAKNVQSRQIILNNFKLAKKVLKRAFIPFGVSASHWQELKSAFLSSDKEQLTPCFCVLKLNFHGDRLVIAHIAVQAI